MYDVPSVFVLLPFLSSEDVAPGTTAPYDGLKPAQLLHGEDLVVGKSYVRIMLLQAISNGRKVCRPVLQYHSRPVVMAKGFVRIVKQTSITGRQCVSAKISGFRNDVQSRSVFPINAKEASAKIPRSVDHTP